MSEVALQNELSARKKKEELLGFLKDARSKDQLSNHLQDQIIKVQEDAE